MEKLEELEMLRKRLSEAEMRCRSDATVGIEAPDVNVGQLDNLGLTGEEVNEVLEDVKEEDPLHRIFRVTLRCDIKMKRC